jgi:hypothetical protein
MDTKRITKKYPFIKTYQIKTKNPQIIRVNIDEMMNNDVLIDEMEKLSNNEFVDIENKKRHIEKEK